MKHKIRPLINLLVIIVGVVFLFACSKNDEADKNKTGHVIGYVADKCGCCPGWLVEYNGDTLKFENVPESETLHDLVNFYGYPLPINFTYKDDSGNCSDYYKIMTSIDFISNTDCSKIASIIDYADTECACCPGWIIKTGEDTIKALTLPIESQVRQISEVDGFPISVIMDYESITGSCAEFYKQITCMTLNQ